MICLPALCIAPLKGRVIGFQVGARADMCLHFRAALYPSGILGNRLNEHTDGGLGESFLKNAD